MSNASHHCVPYSHGNKDFPLLSVLQLHHCDIGSSGFLTFMALTCEHSWRVQCAPIEISLLSLTLWRQRYFLNLGFLEVKNRMGKYFAHSHQEFLTQIKNLGIRCSLFWDSLFTLYKGDCRSHNWCENYSLDSWVGQSQFSPQTFNWYIWLSKIWILMKLIRFCPN